MDSISAALAGHYAKTFAEHGATSSGVDWGADEGRLQLRYDKMLELIPQRGAASILDVGCGFGGLQNHALACGFDLDYTGIDVAGNMIEWARSNGSPGNYVHGDVLSHEFDRQFDYVICNGILTQKLHVESLRMDEFAGRLIRRMFQLCRQGLAFNVMTSHVNYFAGNLYYRNPAELLAWCQLEITPHVRLDHSYPLYEYTVYLYREPSAPRQAVRIQSPATK